MSKSCVKPRRSNGASTCETAGKKTFPRPSGTIRAALLRPRDRVLVYQSTKIDNIWLMKPNETMSDTFFYNWNDIGSEERAQHTKCHVSIVTQSANGTDLTSRHISSIIMISV